MQRHRQQQVKAVATTTVADQADPLAAFEELPLHNKRVLVTGGPFRQSTHVCPACIHLQLMKSGLSTICLVQDIVRAAGPAPCIAHHAS